MWYVRLVQDPELGLIWADLKHVHEIVGAALAERMETEAGLGVTEAYVLFRLANEPDGCLRMGTLAERLDMAQSGVTRVVDRLEERGLVRRQSPRDNRRTTYAHLTDEGRHVFSQIRPIFFETVHQRLAGPLSEPELTQLRETLRKLIVAYGRCEEAPWECPDAEARGIGVEHSVG